MNKSCRDILRDKIRTAYLKNPYAEIQPGFEDSISEYYKLVDGKISIDEFLDSLSPEALVSSYTSLCCERFR